MTPVFWMDWLFSWFRQRIALLPGGFSPVVLRRSPNLL